MSIWKPSSLVLAGLWLEANEVGALDCPRPYSRAMFQKSISFFVALLALVILRSVTAFSAGGTKSRCPGNVTALS